MGAVTSEQVIAAAQRALEVRERSVMSVVDALGEDVAKECPHLVAMLCDPSMDQQRLRMLMGVVGKINTGEVEEQEASLAVGTALVEEYVKPMLKKK